MKNFLSKNWTKILIIIAIIFIVLNILSKCVAPHILVEEYAKYGPEVKNSGIDIDANGILENIVESAPSGVPKDIIRIVVTLGVALLLIVIISELITKKSSTKKK